MRDIWQGEHTAAHVLRLATRLTQKCTNS